MALPPASKINGLSVVWPSESPQTGKRATIWATSREALDNKRGSKLNNNGINPEAAALPEIHINLSAVTLAELNDLLVTVAHAAAPKWREMGVEMTQHPIPVVAMSGENVAVQYIKTGNHMNVVCHHVIELPSLPALAEVVSQKAIYQRGYDAMRKLVALADQAEQPPFDDGLTPFDDSIPGQGSGQQ